jgi:hypothetical protein
MTESEILHIYCHQCQAEQRSAPRKIATVIRWYDGAKRWQPMPARPVLDADGVARMKLVDADPNVRGAKEPDLLTMPDDHQQPLGGLTGYREELDAVCDVHGRRVTTRTAVLGWLKAGKEKMSI